MKYIIFIYIFILIDIGKENFIADASGAIRKVFLKSKGKLDLNTEDIEVTLPREGRCEALGKLK